MLASGWGVRNVRILLQVTGMLGPAACLVLAVSPAVGASAELASNLITIGTGLSALTLGGVSASHLDIAPRHAGVIFGAGNTAATLAGLLSVPFTGYLLQVGGYLGIGLQECLDTCAVTRLLQEVLSYSLCLQNC
jgi:ACS family sodium-dependent inorganic phosphate cotransporter